MPRKKKAFYFLLQHFQLLMDVQCEDAGFSGYWQLREIVGLCRQYKQLYGLHNYKTSHIWSIIKRKYEKQWDDLSYEMFKR